jgi:uncharacterized membrane protein HdeD (DUF308 family)
MAEEVQITPEGSMAKIRNPWIVVLLEIVTIGIYFFFWWYYVNREMADYGRSRGTTELGDNPGKSVLAVTLGALIIVPAILSIIHTFKRVQATQRLTGQTPINGWLGLVLYLVISLAYPAYMQSGLNGAWRAVSATAAPPAPEPTPAT